MENLNIQPSEGTGIRATLRIQVARTKGKISPSVNFSSFLSFPLFNQDSVSKGRESLMAQLGPLTFTLAGDGQSSLNNSPQKTACTQLRVGSSKENQNAVNAVSRSSNMDAEHAKNLGGHYWIHRKLKGQTGKPIRRQGQRT